MPFDPSGNFSRVHNWQQDRENGIRILADRHDEEDDNFAAGFNQVFLRNGLVPMTGNLNMNGHSIGTIKAGSAASPSLTWELAPNTGFFQINPATIGLSSLGVLTAEFGATGIVNHGDFNVAGWVSSDKGFNGTWAAGGNIFIGSAYPNPDAPVYALGMHLLADTRETRIFSMGADSTGFITFHTGAGPTTEKMRLDYVGNLSIVGRLEVGSQIISAGTVGGAAIAVRAPAPAMYWQNEVGGTTFGTLDHTGVHFSLSNLVANGGLGFNTLGAGSFVNFNLAGTLVMTALASGSVGLATATPSARLDVSGIIRSVSQAMVPTAGVGIEMSFDGTNGSILVYDRGGSGYKPLRFAGTYIHLLPQGGYVGIGNTNPEVMADVDGHIRTRSGVVYWGADLTKFIQLTGGALVSNGAFAAWGRITSGGNGGDGSFGLTRADGVANLGTIDWHTANDGFQFNNNNNGIFEWFFNGARKMLLGNNGNFQTAGVATFDGGVVYFNSAQNQFIQYTGSMFYFTNTVSVAAGSVQVGVNAANGSVALQPGNAGNSGYIEFNYPGGTRAGYIGFAPAGGAIAIAADGLGYFSFNAQPKVLDGGMWYDNAAYGNSRVTQGTAAPSGGADGDIYLQYS